MMADSFGETTGRGRSSTSMGGGPLVSVLLPTYNRRRYLPGALASVLAQTHRELQVLVVRDGGEEVADVVRSFHDPRVVFIDRKENRGKPHSLNEALSRAQGKYVAYLDDDDAWYPHHVETLVRALETETDCQVAYSDLYRVYCETRPGSERVVRSKYVEISRDFDRFLMLYFNHVLHVSLMHRRDLLDKTGPYTESLNILIDWDITRRLAFFSDFHHSLTITGEFYCPLNESDRISDVRRRDSEDYLRNVLAIRTTHPPRPWPKIGELSIILATDHLDQQVGQTLMRIWRHTFYPYRLYLPLPAADLSRLNIGMPNVVLVPVEPQSSVDERVDVALQRIESGYVGIMPAGLPVEDMWIEDPMHAILHNDKGREGFLIEGACNGRWGAVVSRADLQWARQAHPHLSVEASLMACGVRVRRPKPEELAFQFDELLRRGKLAEADGDWLVAARLFEQMGRQYRNELWMKTMAARAYCEAGQLEKAGHLSREVNRVRPTIDTLLLEAKVCRQERDFAGAIRLLSRAEQGLSGCMDSSPIRPGTTVQYSQTPGGV
ncbi:MAG TPA: glycosyltransferase [Sedimentisphaerales bacterium]|nr:glycosyltransferase [Sedimentisphaerales bacterium]HNU27761.1 glycosyltransferase [Sedimentisphaerales bacterium]